MVKMSVKTLEDLKKNLPFLLTLIWKDILPFNFFLVFASKISCWRQ